MDQTAKLVKTAEGLTLTDGKEAVLAALDDCTGVNGNKLRYLTNVLANMGTPKPEEGKAYMSDEEEQSISSRLVFGDEEDL